MTDSPFLGLPVPGEDDLPDSPAQIQAVIDRLEALRGGYAEIGAMADYAGQTDPNPTSGCWLITDGRKLLRTDYPALYTLIGTRFNTGGEATTEFRIPLIAHRMVYAAQAGDTPGAVGGASSVALSNAQMPVHRHGGATGAGATGGGTSGSHDVAHGHTIPGAGGMVVVDGSMASANIWPAGAIAAGHTPAILANGPQRWAAVNGATAPHQHSVPSLSVPALSIANDGGASGVTQPHENMPPYITFFKIIRVR